MASVRRGDVVLAALNPTVGKEIRKTRPAVVVSNDRLNDLSGIVVVIPLTKNARRVSPSHAIIPRGIAGLAFTSKAVTEHVRAIDRSRIVRQLGRLPARLLADIEDALVNTLDL